jgi:hypothetical protein
MATICERSMAWAMSFTSLAVLQGGKNWDQKKVNWKRVVTSTGLRKLPQTKSAHLQRKSCTPSLPSGANAADIYC